MEKTVFHLPEKQFLPGKMKFFCKNWLPHNLNNGYHQQKEYYNTKEYHFTYTEKILQLFSASGNYYWN